MVGVAIRFGGCAEFVGGVVIMGVVVLEVVVDDKESDML